MGFNVEFSKSCRNQKVRCDKLQPLLKETELFNTKSSRSSYGFPLIILPLTRFGSLGAGEILARAHHVRCLKPFNGYIRVDGWSWSSTSLRKPLVKKCTGEVPKIKRVKYQPKPTIGCWVNTELVIRCLSVTSHQGPCKEWHLLKVSWNPLLSIMTARNCISVYQLYTCIAVYLYIISVYAYTIALIHVINTCSMHCE